jgi:hypothetical protein
MSIYKDNERMDFLERQHFTKWVGFNHLDNALQSTVWPVFGTGLGSLRSQIDLAMKRREDLERAAGTERTDP